LVNNRFFLKNKSGQNNPFTEKTSDFSRHCPGKSEVYHSSFFGLTQAFLRVFNRFSTYL